MRRLSAAAFCLAFLSASCGVGGDGTPDGTTGSVFPLRVATSSRYLVDQKNVPSPLIGDDASSLMVNASLSDADYYLANRASHGFNIVGIELICNAYGGGRSDATTFDGLKPFTAAGDISTPNEAYFARCDEMIRSAARHGITVLLNPAEAAGF
ncbi:MAG: apiosidase-like domain-containing protein, partial [Candidatus Aminicenantales bacterium]